MKLAHGLSGVAIVCALGVHSGAAMATPAQVSNSPAPSHTEPVLIADFFRDLRNTIDIIQEVDQTIDSLNQGNQERTTDPQEVQRPSEQLEQRSVEPAPVQSNENQDLHQRLARRSGEAHEAWYDRINPLIQHVPGADYRAWKATLSAEDNDAYDAIVRQRNYEAAEIMNRATPLIWEGVLQEEAESRQRQRENDCQYDGYCY